MCQNEVVEDLKQRRPSVEQIIRIGMDTSKHVFHLHGVNAAEDEAKVLLAPNLNTHLEFYRVGRQVNSSKYEGADCIEPTNPL